MRTVRSLVLSDLDGMTLGAPFVDPSLARGLQEKSDLVRFLFTQCVSKQVQGQSEDCLQTRPVVTLDLLFFVYMLAMRLGVSLTDVRARVLRRSGREGKGENELRIRNPSLTWRRFSAVFHTSPF